MPGTEWVLISYANWLEFPSLRLLANVLSCERRSHVSANVYQSPCLRSVALFALSARAVVCVPMLMFCHAERAHCVVGGKGNNGRCSVKTFDSCCHCYVSIQAHIRTYKGW